MSSTELFGVAGSKVTSIIGGSDAAGLLSFGFFYSFVDVYRLSSEGITDSLEAAHITFGATYAGATSGLMKRSGSNYDVNSIGGGRISYGGLT